MGTACSSLPTTTVGVHPRAEEVMAAVEAAKPQPAAAVATTVVEVDHDKFEINVIPVAATVVSTQSAVIIVEPKPKPKPVAVKPVPKQTKTTLAQEAKKNPAAAKLLQSQIASINALDAPVKVNEPPKVADPPPAKIPTVAAALEKMIPPVMRSQPLFLSQVPAKKDWRWTTVPESMKKLFDLAKATMKSLWPDLKTPSFILAKIEQETCISPTSKRCGSTQAELKTNREYGFGYGQTTIAYNKDGTERFNVWKDLRNADPMLRQKWTWENRFDSELQMRAVIIKSRMSHSAVRFPTKDEQEHTAFGAADYNSGSPITDRRLCMAQSDCDPSSWFDTAEKKGVESYSVKNRVAQKGYGKSFYEISREYPRLVVFIRREKYIPFVDK